MCEWKSKYYADYECHERAMELDGQGYCILHSRHEDKGTDKFTEKVKERMSTTEDRIDLRGCYFPKDFPAEYFERCTFEKPVDFTEATFSQWADFSNAIFLQGADFYRATFSGALFFETTFSQEANFFGATFSWADFIWATFSQEAVFSEATFSGDFYDAIFSQRVDFSGAKLKEVNFLGTHFEKGAIFSHTEFKDRVLFLPTKFEKTEKEKKVKELRRVILGPSEFYRTRFLGEVVFEDIDLSQCSFLHSNIDKVDFRYCKFGEGKERLLGIIPHLRQNVLKDELDCDKAPNKDYEPVHRLYLELKKNFEEKRDWNTAGDFHYGEMECRRKMKEGWLRRNIFSLEALYYWASGYGERPKRAGLWMMLLILVCALFYMPSTDKASPSLVLEGAGQTLVETASQEPAGSTVQEYPKGIFHEPAVPGLPAKGCSGRACSTFKRYLEGLNTSLRVTARLDTKETGWPRTIQSILGPLFIALFALALRRKVKR